VIVFKKSDTEFAGCIKAAINIQIRNANQLYIFKQTQNPGMVLSHVTNTDHSHPNGVKLTTIGVHIPHTLNPP
jgi:hypothetical protein